MTRYNNPIKVSAAHTREEALMGKHFTLTVIDKDADWAAERMEAAVNEIKRIEELLSTTNEDSYANQIKNNAGARPVKVNKEVYHLIARSLKISTLTQGCHDITFGSIDTSLWNFNCEMRSLPDTVLAARTVRLINYKNVQLNQNNCSVLLKRKGMQISFCEIERGYAMDKAKELMIAQGVENGAINAGGDIVTWGRKSHSKPWTIAVADPDQAKLPFSTLPIGDMAFATSGHCGKVAEIEGKKYSHTIDPRSGLPVTGIKSTSIICPSAELATALATPVLIMGVRTGLNLINQLPQIACIIMDDDDKIHFTRNINIMKT